MQADPTRPRQTLIFDADDTLWENNVYFMRVVDDYLDWVAHPTLDAGQIRTMLNDIEAANVSTRGYGTAAFLENLADCLQLINQRPATAAERRTIEQLAEALISTRIELMPGVAATLATLGGRHDLLLLTKGDRAEQQRKVAASGLEGYFGSVNIVPEKNALTYRSLVDTEGLRPDTTWMIGNSPKSDIVAARQAGLNAVFIPHRHTWELELADVDLADPHVLVLEAFPELLRHF